MENPLNEGKACCQGRDCQEIYPPVGEQMIQIFQSYNSSSRIQDDFLFFDEQERLRKEKIHKYNKKAPVKNNGPLPFAHLAANPVHAQRHHMESQRQQILPFYQQPSAPKRALTASFCYNNNSIARNNNHAHHQHTDKIENLYLSNSNN